MVVDTPLILVTGAAGSVGSVGHRVTADLRRRGLSVRAFVHREDERADALRALGAEVAVGDLTRPADVVRALDGCHRLYFGMGVSDQYLRAALVTAAAARAHGRLEVYVNMSQLTVSQMDLTSTAESTQQREHWLTEQLLDWSGLPVTEVRPTVFLENPLFRVFCYASIARDGTIRLPFGRGRTSPVAAADVARVVAAVLADPGPYIGRALELTGPRSQDMWSMAEEFSAMLGRPVTYVDVPFDEFERAMRAQSLPDHVVDHVTTMARLHAENRYDRMTHVVEEITGRPAEGVREYVRDNPELFRPTGRT
ncbi:NAD(P)H-binding protein [Streptomyces sp. NPDC052040]|uniref:NmrA family NAD(P)-binding protein n=1 Tax=unclassified Streptomyces TaxID=2593676 RepID=UPI0037CDFC5C